MNLNIVSVFHASSTGSREVPALQIQATKPIPSMESPDEARELHATQAARIAAALFESLPGGTVDALLVEMMRRKASLLSVAHTQPDAQS